MTDLMSRGNAETALRVRGPAYGVITECLRIQASARRQSRLARVFGADPLQPDARSWYRGALGEIHVANVLKHLGPQWTVLHAIGAVESDADHVVIGPGGVFTINTKNHAGQRVWVGSDSLLVNGHRTNHITNARFEALRAAKLLNSKASERVTVTPLIAIVDPGSLAFGSNRAEDVIVVRSARLARTIARSKRILSDDAIAELATIADDGGTWHSDARVLDDTLRHEARFRRLQHDVDAAARRRYAWVLLGVLAVVAGVAAIFAASGAAGFGALLP